MARKHEAAPAAELTHNQQAVLGVLRAAERPMSAYQILERTAAEGMKAPPQVYRALQKLSELKLIHRVEALNAYVYCGHGPHAEEVAFAICDSCGSVSEIPLPKVRPQLSETVARHGFTFHDAQVEIHGACGACASKIT